MRILTLTLLVACGCHPRGTETDDRDAEYPRDGAPSNTPPTVDALTLTPAAPRTHETLTARATASDADGDAVTVRYAWTVDGAPTGSDAPTLADDAIVRGAVVSVTVTPHDGQVDGAPVTVSTTVVNTAPQDLVVLLAPTDPLHGDDLVCGAVAVDADADALTYAFAWSVDGVPYTDATDDTDTSVVDGADVVGGTVWTCTVTATDPEGASVAAEASAPIADTCVDGATHALTDTARAERETVNAVVTDADADGYDDILFVNQLSSSVTLWWGDAAGPHAAETTVSMGRVGYGVDAGDINGDGFVDVVASNQDAGTFTVAWGNGPRTFWGTTSFGQSGFPQGVTLVDADRDGDLDLLSMLGAGWGATVGSSCNALRINDGSGTFAPGACLWMDTHLRRAADLDGDGYAELVTSTTGEVYSSSSGAFVLAYTVPMDGVASPSSVFPADADGDGDVDLLVVDATDSSLTTVTNHGGGVFRSCARSAPLPAWPYAVGHLDTDGDVDFASVSTCSFCSSTYRVGLRD
jgi:hypothetical protein